MTRGEHCQMRPVTRRFARFVRAGGGATAVEFAIVAPVFFFMVAVILEMGMMLLTEYTLQKAVENASRGIQIGDVQNAGQTGDQFRQAICDEADTLTDCNARLGLWVSSADNFAALVNGTAGPPAVPALPGLGNFTPGVASRFVPGSAAQAVAVIATYDWPFFFPPIMAPLSNVANLAGRRLQGTATFRNEPF